MDGLTGHRSTPPHIFERKKSASLTENCSFTDVDKEDCCELPVISETTLVNNLKARYFKDKIYTYIANVLIIINPYKKMVDMYDDNYIQAYVGRSLGEKPPHIFAIAEKTLRDMRRGKISQSIVISGESGAGKTESARYLIKYLCRSSNAIENKLLHASPILEAFGNARMELNNNSSRFGRYVEIHYNEKYQIVGGRITNYLLEMTRVCCQNADEWNYHVFYMLCVDAPQMLRDKLHLKNADNYKYLKGSASTLHLIGAFKELDKSLAEVNLCESARFEIYKLIAAVLHLGNIFFEENSNDGCRLTIDTAQNLEAVADLAGISINKLNKELTHRTIQCRSEQITVPLRIDHACTARNALAKAFYSCLFEHICVRINENISTQEQGLHIGILDFPGFECVAVNSFEQFCINYCNEKIQKVFCDIIMKDEQETYIREGLIVPIIPYNTNDCIIEMIESNKNGIFSILNDETKMRQSSANFTAEVIKEWHTRLSVSHLVEDGFVINHFAGPVHYSTGQFVIKNKHLIHGSLADLLLTSSNRILKGASFSDKANLTAGSLFKMQLSALMEILKKNGVSFVRCIKPNSNQKGGEFVDKYVIAQLNGSGMTNMLKLMQNGFPCRIQFTDIYEIYKPLMPFALSSLEPQICFKILLRSMELNETDFKFGTTKLFFGPGKYTIFDSILKGDPEHMLTIVKDAHRYLIRYYFRRAIFAVVAVIKVQKYMKERRKNLSRKQLVDNTHDQDSLPLIRRRASGEGKLDPALIKRVRHQERSSENERDIIRPKDYRKKCTTCKLVNQGTKKNKYHLTYKKVSIGHECPKCYASRIRSHKKLTV